MSRKYEFTGETKTNADGVTLHRIRALVDIPCWDVFAGVKGGWIESSGNLSHAGAAWIQDEAEVYGDAWVGGDAIVRSNAIVSGNAHIAGNAIVGGAAKVHGSASVDVRALVVGNAHIYECAIVAGRAVVSANATISGSAYVTGDVHVRDNARVSGTARVLGRAEISRQAYIVRSSDYLHADVSASDEFDATLTRQNDGTAWLTVGCWSGTLDGFRVMIDSDRWVDATPEIRELRRPELLAFAAMCEARAQTWPGDAA